MPTQANVHFAKFRRCEFGRLTSYKSTGEQLLHGNQEAYGQLIQFIADNSAKFNTVSEEHLISDIMHTRFNIEPTLEGVVTYSSPAVEELFPTLKPKLLSSLINAHLHEHFLRQHPVVAIVDPVEDSQLTVFRQQVALFANSIAQCPSSPIAGSCPPKLHGCRPCKPGSVVRLRTLATIPHNAFVLVAVPHPYTFLSYVNQKQNLDARFVRDTRRDSWVVSVTSEIADKGTGGFQRTQIVKEYVETDSTTMFDSKIPAGIWQTWEELDLDGLESTLGFEVEVVEDKKHETSRAPDSSSIPFNAKDRVLSQSSERSRDMVESWNLAWTELWYFIRALQRRRKSEQLDLVGRFSFS